MRWGLFHFSLVTQITLIALIFSSFSWIIHFLYLLLQSYLQKKGEVMTNSEYLNKFSKNLFWDADISQMRMEDHAPYIIQRVMEFGQMDDWRLINHYYGLERITEECKKIRTLDPICLSFICTISHTKEEEYRCYHFRQSCQTPWNS